MSIEDPRISVANDEFLIEDSGIGIDIETSEAAILVAQADTGIPEHDPAPDFPGELTVGPDGTVRLPLGIVLGAFRVDGANLILVQADGSEIVIIDGALRIPAFIIGEVEIPQEVLLAALDASGIDVAAGPDGSFSATGGPQGSGANFDLPPNNDTEDEGPSFNDLLGDTSFSGGEAGGEELLNDETNVTPEIVSGPHFGGVVESVDNPGGVDADPVPVSGTITFSDFNAADTHTIAISGRSFQSFTGTGTLTPAQVQALLDGFTLGATTLPSGGANGSIAWLYALGNDAVDFLAAGERVDLVFAVTISDAQSSTSTTVSISVTGANDIPVFENTAAPIAYTEGEAAGISESGTITFTDADLSDAHGVDAALGTIAWKRANSDDIDFGAYPELDFDALKAALENAFAANLDSVATNGNTGSIGWTFDASDGLFDFLAKDERLTIEYGVTVDDGKGGTVTTPVTVTVTGTNDEPEVAPDTKRWTESEIHQTFGTGNALSMNVFENDSDVDTTDVLLVARWGSFGSNGLSHYHQVTNPVSDPANVFEASIFSTHGEAQVFLTRSGELKLIVTDGAPFTDLADGQEFRISLNYSVSDGTSEVATSAVLFVEGETGVNPPVGADVKESGDVLDADGDKVEEPGIPEAGGSLYTFAEAPAALNVEIEPNGSEYGTFDVDPDTGTWTYELDNDRPATQALKDGEKVQETFEIRVEADGVVETYEVTITIEGTNDLPAISVVSDGRVDEDDLSGIVASLADVPLNITWAADDYDANGDLEGRVSFDAVTSSAATVDAPYGTSRGDVIKLFVSADGLMAVGYVGDAGPIDAGTGLPTGVRIVFTASVDPQGTGSGSYSFELHDTLDHPDTSGEDEITLRFDLLVTDDHGVEQPHSFSVVVIDDVPTPSSTPSSGVVVEESALADPIDWGSGNWADILADLLGGGTVAASDTLADTMDFGSDGAAAGGGFVFKGDIGDLEDMALTSNGDTIQYVALDLGGQSLVLGYVSTISSSGLNAIFSVLEDVANGNPPNPFEAFNAFVAIVSGGDFRMVFSLHTKGNGEYTFRLFDPLDHTGDDDAALTIDFSSLFAAEDGDGDRTDLPGGALTVTITDDVPVVTAVSGAMEENQTISVALGHSFGADGAGGVTLGEAYADNDLIDISGVTITFDETTGEVTIDPGTAMDRLAADDTAILTIPYTVHDRDGDSVTSDIIVTITGTNDAPVIEAILGGEEFLVNSVPDGFQLASVVAGLESGGFVAVWEAMGNTHDGDGTAIKGRLFGADGAPLGEEFLVNSEHADAQIEPSVTGLSGGGFVVTWRTEDTNQDDEGSAIKGRVFDPDGTPGSEFLVNTAGVAAQTEPSVTGLSGGGFVVTWTTEDTVQGGDGKAIKGQIFAADGTPLGGEFLVNDADEGNQIEPSITGLANGGFVVTWTTSDTTQDGSYWGLKGRVFAADGTPGGEFLVNSATDRTQHYPAVTGLSGGGFVVTWVTEDQSQDGDNKAIKGRLFGADGMPQGSEFLVNSEYAGAQAEPAVTGLSGGGFVITWRTFDFSQDGEGSAIKGRIFAADGTPLGGEFLVNSAHADSQEWPSVTALADGGFAVTWTTADPTQDGSNSAIKGRVFHFSVLNGAVTESGDLALIDEAGPGGKLTHGDDLTGADAALDAIKNGATDAVAFTTAFDAIQAITGNEAATFAVFWQYLDGEFDPNFVEGGNDPINVATARLGIAYALYLEDGGMPLVDIVAQFKADADGNGTPDRMQSLHDNLLGNANGGVLATRFSGTLLAELQAAAPAYLLAREWVSGYEDDAHIAANMHADDMGNGYAPSATGQVVASDLDDGASWTFAVKHETTDPFVTESTGTYGTLSIDEDTGKWTYVLNDHDPDTQALAQGELVYDTFTVEVKDEHGATDTETLTITITGANDAPVITGTTSAPFLASGLEGFVEAGEGGRFEPETGTDLDTAIDAAFDHHGDDMASILMEVQAAIGPNATEAQAIAYVWDFLDDPYVADGPHQPDINQAFTRLGIEYAKYLKLGNPPLLDIIAKFTPDGSDPDDAPDRIQSLHDNLLGNIENGALMQRYVNGSALYNQFKALIEAVDPDLLARPYYSGDEGSTVTEAQVRGWDGLHGYAPASAGQFTATDVDQPAGTPLEWSATAAAYGRFAIDAETGEWSYTLDHSRPATQALAAGEGATETVTITVTDEHGATGTFTHTIIITGINDAPVLTLDPSSAAVTEDDLQHGLLQTWGLFTFSDPEGDAVTITGTFVGAEGSSGDVDIPVALLEALEQSLIIYPGFWNFDLDNDLVKYLETGQSVIATYTVIATDSHGASSSEMVTITINGVSNALPVITSAILSGSVEEDATAGELIVNGDFGTNSTLGWTVIDPYYESYIGGYLGYGFVATSYNNSVQPVSLIQDVPTVEGQTYTISFLAGGILLQPSHTNSITVYWNGQPVLARTAIDSANLEYYTVDVVGGPGDNTTLEIAMTTGHWLVLDNISVISETGLGREWASGTIDFSDADVIDTHTVTALANDDGYFGTFTPILASASGGGTVTWIFTVNDADIQHLKAGETIQQTYTVAITDGEDTVSREVTVEIHGTNDAPFVTSAQLSGSVTEEAVGSELVVNGAFNTDTAGWTIITTPASEHYRTASGNPSNGLGIRANSDDMPVLLNQDVPTTEGETYTVSFWASGVRTSSTSNSLTVYWNGVSVLAESNVNDGVSTNLQRYTVDVIGGPGQESTLEFAFTGQYFWIIDNISVISDRGLGAERTTGTIDFTDIDINDQHTVTTSGSDGYLGVFTANFIDSATGDGQGTVAWTFSVDNAAIQHLGANDSIVQTYTVRIEDSANEFVERQVSVTINGTNDAPELTGDLAAAIDAGETYVLTADDLGFADPDDDSDGVTFTVSNLSNGTIWVDGAQANSFTGTQLADGLVEFRHDGSTDTTASFEVAVEDGDEDGSVPVPQTFNFAVTVLNTPPQINDDMVITNIGVQSGSDRFSIPYWALLANDTDAEGDAISITGTTLVNGELSNASQSADTAAGILVLAEPGGAEQDGGRIIYHASAQGQTSSGTITIDRAQIGQTQLDGTAGDEILLGSSGADTVDGGAGVDIILAGNGDDTIIADDDDYRIDGQGGTDTLRVTSDFVSKSDDQVRNVERVEIIGNNVDLDLSNQSEGFKIFLTGNSASTWNVSLGASDGTDHIVFRNAEMGINHDSVAVIENFDVDNDKITVLFSTSTNISNANFLTIDSNGTDIPAPDGNILYEVLEITSGVGSLTSDSNGGAIEQIIASAIRHEPKGGYYTVVVYSSTDSDADAGIYQMLVTNGNQPNLAPGHFEIEHLMTLKGVGFGNLTTDNFDKALNADPIILDLDGNGYAFDANVAFDLDGDGAKDKVAWNSSGDGILAFDRNGNGVIDDGTEMFTPWFDGGDFVTGGEALASLDANGDGVIDMDDPAFANLVIWRDENADGITDAGELTSLADNGITSISAPASPADGIVDGQPVIGEGTFTREDGSTGDYIEVALETVFGQTVTGTDGDDILAGGDGEDILTGGKGADIFVVDDLDIADLIADYDFGEGDRIDLSALLDGLANTGDGVEGAVSKTFDGDTGETSILVGDTEAVRLAGDHTSVDVSVLFTDDLGNQATALI